MPSASTSEDGRTPERAAVITLAPARLARWVHNFEVGHGATELAADAGDLSGRAADGSWFRARLPFSRSYDGPPTTDDFVAAAVPPPAWGILLVRKGGFAVAALQGAEVVASKVGQRHVQGRTKAGGQSQQRFARRRENQARTAFGAAAEHAARLVAGVPVLVVGGDSVAVGAVLEDPRLRLLADRVAGRFLSVADPRRTVLDAACAEAQSLVVEVLNAPGPQPAVL